MVSIFIEDAERTLRKGKGRPNRNKDTGYICYLHMGDFYPQDAVVEIFQSSTGIKLKVGEVTLPLHYVSLLIEAHVKSIKYKSLTMSGYVKSLSYFFLHLPASRGFIPTHKNFNGVTDWTKELVDLYKNEGIKLTERLQLGHLTEATLDYLLTEIESGRLEETLRSTLLIRENDSRRATILRCILIGVLRPFASEYPVVL